MLPTLADLPDDTAQRRVIRGQQQGLKLRTPPILPGINFARFPTRNCCRQHARNAQQMAKHLTEQTVYVTIMYSRDVSYFNPNNHN
jgi:hypothetical protein